MLDDKKAFDTVWNKGLFYKLVQLALDYNRHLWLCKYDFLSDLESGRHGAQLSSTDMRVCCPAYADDIALVAIKWRTPDLHLLVGANILACPPCMCL